MITKLRLSSDTRPFQFGLQRGLYTLSAKERFPFRFHCVCKGKHFSRTCKSLPENLQLFALWLPYGRDYSHFIVADHAFFIPLLSWQWGR